MTPKRGHLCKASILFYNDCTMNIIMNTTRIVSINDIESFLQGLSQIEITTNSSKKEKYNFILETLIKLKYKQIRKKNKRTVKRYLQKVTGYSDNQIKRLIKKWKNGKLLASLEIMNNNRTRFPCKYRSTEIGLLAKADDALNYPNGNALKESLIREHKVFKKEDFKTISQISVSHIYNLRNNSSQYQSATMHYTKTNPVNVPIGERRKPIPDGKPGYLRIDSVHQGDFNGVKGVYHINIVDEITQWEAVGCVEVISEKFLIPLLENLIDQFPFRIINFHSDNGSEYINYQVKDMLSRLLVKQTKSRSRKTNDNALVEGKNGSVIRKHIGRKYIPKKYARSVDSFYQEYFNTFINYHRVCSFATDYIDKKGKIRKKYDIYLTPYDRFKLLKNAEKYLRKELAILLKAENTPKECANLLGFTKRSVNREIKLNKDSDEIYRGAFAHKKYLIRRLKAKGKSKKIQNDEDLKKYITKRLKKKDSPEQICGRITNKLTKEQFQSITFPTVYN